MVWLNLMLSTILIQEQCRFTMEIKKIKDIVLNTDPSAEWVVSYGKVVDGKISTATAPIQESFDTFKKYGQF